MKNRIYLDVHVLQTVPPSCVNRDDAGSPKTAIYGGTTRARVSSQAWKHAMREMFRDELFDTDMLALRTKYVAKMVADEILKLNPDAKAAELAEKVLTNAGVKFKKDDKSAEKKAEALFFMSTAQAKALAAVAAKDKKKDEDDAAKSKKNDKDECEDALKNNPSVDIALFGRMVASDPTLNCDASAQVAHSISTHTVQNEYDYFTAVDDLSPEDNAGAGHLGTVEFNSSTLYRYATVNLVELADSLKEKSETVKTARGFVEAFVRSMPTGKQNTFANRTLPSMVYVTIRRDQPVNLCGAFEKPVSARDGGYSAESEKRFVEYANSVYEKYAAKPDAAFAVGDESLIGSIADCMSFDRLLESVEERVREYLGESEGM